MPDTYRILVTGSRTWWDHSVIASELTLARAYALEQGREPVVVHGDCPKGADRHAALWAEASGMQVEAHPAQWDRYGKAAGFRRNAEMVEAGADVCLAFILDSSRGATHCADLAATAGIPVRRWKATTDAGR